MEDVERVKDVLRSKLSKAEFAKFKEADLVMLAANKFSDIESFQAAAREDFKDALPPGSAALIAILLNAFSGSAACQSHLLGLVAHMIDVKLEDVLRASTPTPLTLGLEDELLGAKIMSRPDYDHSREGAILHRFSGVNVSGKVEAFKEKLRTSFEEVEKRKLNDEERTLQSGINQCFAQLETPPMWFFDTSQGGMLFSQDKPDCIFSTCRYVVSWLCAVMVGELSWDATRDSERKKCIGQVVARLRKILSTQKGRNVAFGFIVDRRSIQFVGLDVSGGTEIFWWSQEYAFHFEATDDRGFRLLLQMIYADKSLHGYVAPMEIQDLRLGDGRCVECLSVISSRGAANVLLAGTLDGEAVVVKLCPVMEVEVEVLRSVQGVPGILPLLAHGKWDGRRYIVIPLCRTFDEPVDRPGREFLKMLDQVAETMKLLSDRGVYHGDVSASNIVYDEKRYYLIDFGSAVSYFTSDDERTGVTAVFAAVQVLEGKDHCLSSELESLMYVLVYLVMGRRVPWKFVSGTEIVSMYKRAVFSDIPTFEQRILSRVDDKLVQEQLRRLQELFFVPKYQEDVTYEEFCKELLLHGKHEPATTGCDLM